MSHVLVPPRPLAAAVPEDDHASALTNSLFVKGLSIFTKLS
jgi:hypothetical protein